MRNQVRNVVAVLLVGVFIAAPASAFAWSNGPDGANSYGTHDWVVSEACRVAALHGVNWVNVNVAMAASEDPDTVFHDDEYHQCDPRSDSFPAAEEVDYYYWLAVDSLSAGDSAQASYYLGLLSHYLSDACNPLHTDVSAGAAEDSMHLRYEAEVDSNVIPTAQAMDSGFRYVPDPYGLTCEVATWRNRDYASLVNGYIAGGLPSTTGATYSALWSSSGCLTRIIGSIQADALLDQTPDAVYRFYRPDSGTHFYTYNYDEAAKVIGGLSNVYRYEGVAYYADPFLNEVPLYRFYNRQSGTHLYTADENEKSRIIATMAGTYKFEGVAYGVSMSSGRQVHRFYNPGKNVHFYSADPNEIAYVRANLGSIWRYEGPAYRVEEW